MRAGFRFVAGALVGVVPGASNAHFTGYDGQPATANGVLSNGPTAIEARRAQLVSARSG